MKRLFRPAGTGIGSLIIGSTAFLSYVVGLVRDKILAYVFGTSALADIYNASFIIPDFILNACILGALSGVFIPIFVEHIHEAQAKADELGSIFMTVMSSFVVLVSLVAMIFADQLVPLTITNLPPELMGQAVQMTRLMLLYPLLVGLSTTFGAVLQSYGHFMSYGLSSVLYNCGIIVGTLLLVPHFGVFGAGLGVIFGYVAHMGVRLLEMRSIPFRYKPRWDLKNPAFRTIILMMIPRAITLLCFTTVILVFSRVSSDLGTGVFAAQNYARNFQSFAITLFGVSIATAALTELSRQRAKKDDAGFSASFAATVSQTLFFAIPATVGLIFVAQSMLATFLSGGAFKADSLQMTTSMLIVFSLSIPFESLMHVYSRGFYALKRVYLPTIASICYCLLAVISLHLLTPSLGGQAIPTSWVLGIIVQVIILVAMFHKGMRIAISWPTMLGNQVKVVGASALMGIALWGLGKIPVDSIALFLLQVIGGGLTFCLFAWLFKIKEFEQLRRFFLRLVQRLKVRILPTDTPTDHR